MKYNITLNFLPLNTSNFNFKIFCKQALTEEKLWSDDIRKCWITEGLTRSLGFVPWASLRRNPSE